MRATSAEVRETPSRLFYQDPDVADLAPPIPMLKGQVIGRQGERCEHVYVVEAGQVLLSRRGRGTPDHTICVLGPGELFGEGAFLPEREWQVTVHALTGGTLRRLPASHLPRFCQSFPRLTAEILTLLAGRLKTAHERHELLLTDCARERVVGFLQLVAAAFGRKQEDSIAVGTELTHAQIGDMLGLARETVARIFGDLQREGIVHRERRGVIWLRGHLTGTMAMTLITLRLVCGPMLGPAPALRNAGIHIPRARRGRVTKVPARPGFRKGPIGPLP
jgi:CRP/FNR family transcriptional regulator